jgi:hypothetical protein
LKKDEVLEDVQCFLSDEEKVWYANRGKSLKDGPGYCLLDQVFPTDEGEAISFDIPMHG